MGTCGLSALAAVPALAQFAGAESQWTPGEKPNEPIGEAKGIFPGRVVWAHDPAVAKWDGKKENGGWWEDKFTDPDLAEAMFRRLAAAVDRCEVGSGIVGGPVPALQPGPRSAATPAIGRAKRWQ